MKKRLHLVKIGRKMTMKKILALALALCLTLGTSLALAADDPFLPGVNYRNQFTEFGARPSMLNFGSANLAPGQTFDNAAKTGIEKSSNKSMSKALDKLSYYCYAKWQFAQSFDYYYIDAMLVMTDPDGNYYAMYSEHELFDSDRKAIWYCYYDVTDLLKRCRDEHDGTLPKGQYSFSLFFNDMSVRTNTLLLT